MASQIESTKRVTKSVKAQQRKVQDDDDIQYCEFCGVPLKELFGTNTLSRRKYCSAKCRNTATSRLSRARLGIPPPKRAVSKLSNPLYFN